MKPTPTTPRSAGQPGTARKPHSVSGTTPNSDGRITIPRQWTWHHRTLQHLHDRLLQAHQEHSSEAIVAPEMLGNDMEDTARDQTDRDLLWAELGHEDEKLFEIECALQRLRDGTYGFCEETGRAISVERLRAVPWTRYCRSTAERHENGGIKSTRSRSQGSKT